MDTGGFLGVSPRGSRSGEMSPVSTVSVEGDSEFMMSDGIGSDVSDILTSFQIFSSELRGAEICSWEGVSRGIRRVP